MNLLHIIHLKETESTNTYAKALLKNGELSAPFTLIFTDKQTAGRGRLGRTWESKEGDTLCMSLIVPYPHKPAITLLSALAVHKILSKYYGNVKIKWPNDIVAENKKLCGILTESTPNAAVIGTGINLNTLDFSEDITHKATSLRLLTGKTYNDFKLAKKVTKELVKILRETNGELTDAILKEYSDLCINLGREVIFNSKKGVATEIDKDGSLLVRTDEGSEKISFGEVFVSGIY